MSYDDQLLATIGCEYQCSLKLSFHPTQRKALAYFFDATDASDATAKTQG